MASSLSGKTWAKRIAKERASGKTRKRKLRREGSTPAFPIHIEVELKSGPAAKAASKKAAEPATEPAAERPAE